MSSKIGRPTKDNIEFYRHDVNSHEDEKFLVLRDRYGWEGEGKFWALNNLIGQAEGCKLHLEKSYQILGVAKKLDFTLEEFRKYLDFLINECELVIQDGEFIYTNRVQELYRAIKRKSSKNQDHYNKQKEDFQPTESNLKVAESTLKVAESSLKVPETTGSPAEEIKPFDGVDPVRKDMMNYWGVNELSNFGAVRDITCFLNFLSTSGKLEIFKTSFSHYKKHRELSGLTKHSIKNFIGSGYSDFNDGAWSSENWKMKCEEVIKMSGKKTTQSDFVYNRPKEAI